MTDLKDETRATREWYFSLLDLNRSEAVKSVYLSILLERPGCLTAFVDDVHQLCDFWNMVRISDGTSVPFCLHGATAEPMIRPLFYVHRDLRYLNALPVSPEASPVAPDSLPNQTDLPKNEIDVVVVWPGHAALGIELKWESNFNPKRTNDQLRKERDSLGALARSYGCPFVSLICVVPTKYLKAPLPAADAVLSIGALVDSVRFRLTTAQPDWPYALIRTEFERMAVTYSEIKRYTLQQLIDMRPPPDEFLFVGCKGGVEALRTNFQDKVLRRRQRFSVRSSACRIPPHIGYLRFDEWVREVKDKLGQYGATTSCVNGAVAPVK